MIQFIEHLDYIDKQPKIPPWRNKKNSPLYDGCSLHSIAGHMACTNVYHELQSSSETLQFYKFTI